MRLSAAQVQSLSGESVVQLRLVHPLRCRLLSICALAPHGVPGRRPTADEGASSRHEGASCRGGTLPTLPLLQPSP